MQTLISKAKQIRLLILDIDGVLTNGIIYYSDTHHQMKGFHVHDGMGIRLLQNAGIPVAVISSKKSELATKRLSELNIQHVYLGYEQKLPAYNELKQILQLTDEQIAYIGDDLPDLPVLRRVGLPITVPHAPAVIKEHVAMVTKNQAGSGAVREVCDWLLEVQELIKRAVETYLHA